MFSMLGLILLVQLVTIQGAPVDPLKNDGDPKNEHESANSLGLEYERYLQEVVQVLEEDKDFAKKLENVSADHIKSGAIAHELNFVHHNIRTRLDELKRIELDRLRKLAKQEHDAQEYGAGSYSDGRRWRTLEAPLNTIINQRVSKFDHIDHNNPHSFEVQDLHKLIVKATKDLEEIDKKRREEFKRYEMEKEHQYRESLQNMTADQKQEAIKKHDEMVKKHKEHPRIHHPGSKQQLEEVWEEQDHLPKEEFNPKTFFALHDVNSDGYLDQEEVEALLTLEVKKMYDPNNPEDDPNEMEEEYHRMREHIYKEADKNKDGLISQTEFIELTQRSDFEKDEGWRGLDEQQVYNEDELRQYEAKRQELLAQQYGYYMPHPAYQQQPFMHYPPPPQHVGPAYHVAPPGHPQQQGQYYQAPPQFVPHPGQQQFQNQPIHPNQIVNPQMPQQPNMMANQAGSFQNMGSPYQPSNVPSNQGAPSPAQYQHPNQFQNQPPIQNPNQYQNQPPIQHQNQYQNQPINPPNQVSQQQNPQYQQIQGANPVSSQPNVKQIPNQLASHQTSYQNTNQGLGPQANPAQLNQQNSPRH